MKPGESPRGSRWEGAHGLSLHAFEWGSGADGPPLLLVHGFGLSSRVWDPLARRACSSFHVVAPDLRGHGESEHDPEFRYHHVSIGQDLLALLRARDLGDVSIVAHSTAGHAALGLASREAERVARLVLIEAGPELPSRGSGGVGEDAPEERHRFESEDEYVRWLRGLHPRADEELLRHLAPLQLRQQGGDFVPKLDPTFTRRRSQRDPRHRRDFDRESWARQGEASLWRDCLGVEAPTLIIRGELSTRLSRETVDAMTTKMKSARQVEIPGAGHNVMLDRPNELADVVLEFLDFES